jgi:hypothetical protein
MIFRMMRRNGKHEQNEYRKNPVTKFTLLVRSTKTGCPIKRMGERRHVAVKRPPGLVLEKEEEAHDP